MEIRLSNVGLSLNVKVTFPKVSVATDKLFEFAKNLYKLFIEVVATTPLIFVVTIPLLLSNERLLALINEVVETEPPMFEVSTLLIAESKFGTFKLEILAVKILDVEALVVEAFKFVKFAKFPKILDIFANKMEIASVKIF